MIATGVVVDNQMRARTYNVLFLCTGNSCRSIMAEAILYRFGVGRFRPFSAGSRPKGELHPRLARMLKSRNYEPAIFRSKSWDEFFGPNAPELDFVFTLCDDAASEVCPIWPGHPMTAHWGVPDPTAAGDTDAEVAVAFDNAWHILQSRIGLLCNLAIERFDRSSLKNRFEEIGRSTPTRKFWSM